MAIATTCPECKSANIRPEGDQGVSCKTCGAQGQYVEWNARCVAPLKGVTIDRRQRHLYRAVIVQDAYSLETLLKNLRFLVDDIEEGDTYGGGEGSGGS